MMKDDIFQELYNWFGGREKRLFNTCSQVLLYRGLLNRNYSFKWILSCASLFVIGLSVVSEYAITVRLEVKKNRVYPFYKLIKGTTGPLIALQQYLLETFPDTKGYVCHIKVKTRTGILERTIIKLCLPRDMTCLNIDKLLNIWKNNYNTIYFE